MNDIIHLLPDSVANQIAAGEVVQRPSSIVKEMVENSIDAGADDIQVVVVEGGKNCVQVIDNGCGMSETDARMAFERHATSKISEASDIYNLSTMGFRGEALASIAAVAQVEMKTRREEDEIGTLIQIEGAKVVEHKPVACPVGTNIAVRNLFFNIPVRRKFLKKTQTELNNIIQDFERIALVYPDIKFTLVHNETPVYKLPRTNLKQRIADLLGDKTTAQLIPLESETPLVNIVGYVGKPETAKRKGAKQFFFVNGRFMKHQYFHAAVERAFDNIIPAGEHVNYFIYLQVNPQDIDVNVHPTKTEIKFENEQLLWQVINAVVRESIGRYNEIPTIDFSRKDDDINIPAMPNDGRVVRMTATTSNYNPFKSNQADLGRPTYDWQQLYPASSQPTEGQRQEIIVEGTLSNQVPRQTSLWGDDQADADLDAPLEDAVPKEFFQYRERYVVAPYEGGLIVIDQHRAHVKVLFQEYMERIKNATNVTQGLLFPEIIQLNKQEDATLQGIEDDVRSVGFDLTPLGGGAYSLNGVPPGLEGNDHNRLLHNLIWTAMDSKAAVKQGVSESVALAMAQSAAVGYGQKLTQDEMRHLVEDLFALPNRTRTPDGKLIYGIVDDNFIDRLF